MAEKPEAEKIAERNFKLMKQEKKGMDYLLDRQSFVRGVGVDEKNRPCAGANFYFDASSGEIKYFGTPPYTAEEIKPKYDEGMYRAALELNPEGKFSKEIVKVFWWSKEMPTRLIEIEKAPISELAVKVLKLSAELYNSKR